MTYLVANEPLAFGSSRNRRHEVPDVVADQRVDRAVAVLADVVDPVPRVDLVRLGLRALPGGVARRWRGQISSMLTKIEIGLA